VRTNYQLMIPMTLLLVLAGCGQAERWESLPTARPLGADLLAHYPTRRASAATGGRTDVKEPSGLLSLRNALALALARSPELTSFAWSVRQTEAERLQAGLPPNPELETEFENFGGSGQFRGAESLETTIALSQLIELGGKRKKRMKLAQAESRLAGWDYETKRIEVLTEVAGRFIRALAIQEKMKLAQEDLKLAEATLDAAAKRVAAGKAAAVEETRASVEVATGKIRARRIGRELLSAKHQLAAAWGSMKPTFTRIDGNLGRVKPIPTSARLLPLLSQNPEIARWDAELGQRQAALDLASAHAVSDITVGVGFKYANGGNDHAIAAGVSVPLPFFDRNQYGILKARTGLRKARSDQYAAEVRVRAKFEEAYQILAAAYTEALLLRDEVLPAAREAFKISRTLFRQGKSGYLDVLDAQRTFVKARQQYVEALATYHSAVAEVEGIIGQPFDANTDLDTKKKEMDHAK